MIPVLVAVFAFIILNVLLYLFFLYPGKGRKELLAPFKSTYIAHRGLFNKEDAPENSMEAFRRAIDAGYAIELDVHLTRDGQLAVFHDDTLKRMCKEDKKIIDLTFDELSAYRLLESNEGIPLFSDVLKKIDGRVPLLIEIKTDGNVVNTARAVDEATKDYKGAFAVQSFDPRAPYYFKKHRREVPRGILSTKHKAKASGKSPIITLVMTNLLCNFLVRPDFIAYNHKYADQPSFALMRRLYKTDCAAWTVRGEKELKKAKKSFSMFIFDSFIPSK